jgi:hypothetical protein
LLPAWLVSIGVHSAFLTLFLLVTFSATAREEAQIEEWIQSPIDDPQEPDLSKITEGLDLNEDAGIPDVERIGGTNMPGINIPDHPVGPAGDPNSPFVMQPPSGFSNDTGAASPTGVPSISAPVDPIRIGAPSGLREGVFQPGGLAARFLQGESRVKAAMLGGGTGETEAAVGQGLEWLALHQSPSGGWSTEGFHRHARDKFGAGSKVFVCNCSGQSVVPHDVAATALGVLPFLAAGQTHKPIANVKRERDYTKVVEAALRFLISRQDKSTGQLGNDMYEHGLGAIALCEAYGMTADPGLRVASQRAINYIVRAQHFAGGWRYGANQPGDTSVTGWQIMALKSGQMSGLDVPKPALDGATRFLNSVMSATTYGYGYMGAGSDPRLTAVGVLCREYLGWSPRKPELQEGVAILKANPANVKDMYYTYYAAQALHHFGGEAWRDWNTRMTATLLRARDKGADPKHPHQKGSWDPQGDQYGRDWGRVGQTALSVLTLQVYYRHLPLYGRDMGVMKVEN